MQTLKKDMKEGVVKVRLENFDDLWHLERLVDKGDFVTASTKRKTTIKRGSELEYGEKRPMVLTLQAEKLEFHKDSHSLRITGPISSGPDDVQLHSYHTISATPGLVISIKKEKWKAHHLERLKTARVKEPLILICMIDRERADFAGLEHFGIEWLGSINAKKTAKKSMGSKQERSEAFYKEILSSLEKNSKYQNIIIAGPGFERENILNYIKSQSPEMAGKVILEHASNIGKTGVQEVIKTSVNRILKKTRIVKETQMVEELFAEIAKEGPVAYGKDAQKAVEFGAVEILMVSEARIRDFEPIMEKAERLNGRIVIISTEHEAGEKFLSIGGVAAFLRFRMK